MARRCLRDHVLALLERAQDERRPPPVHDISLLLAERVERLERIVLDHGSVPTRDPEEQP